MESVRNSDVWEVFEDGALYSQFVKIGIEEGDYPLWKKGGTVKVHVDATTWCCKVVKIVWVTRVAIEGEKP